MTKGIRGNFTKTGIVCLALLLSLGAMGASYAAWSDTLVVISTVHRSANFDDPFSWVVSNDDAVEDDVPPYGVIDPGDDGSDPSEPQTAKTPCAREDIDVASTTADLIDQFNITITLSNAYPCYYPTIFYGIENRGDVPAKVVSIQVDENALTPDVLDDIPELTVTVTGIYACQTEIDVGQEVIGDLDIHVEQSAAQCHTYTIRVMIVTAPYCAVGGTPGYWQNWPAHYTCEDLTPWLENIDAGSDWLVPDKDSNGIINCYDWDLIRAAGIGGGASAYDRFLMHYCATRLNVEAGRQFLGSIHDITSMDEFNDFEYDEYEFLGLDLTSGTTEDIINAIEGNYSTSDKVELEIMKNICCALNESRI